ncbi:Transcriptional activator spt7, partial [Conglomerata obtusa]
MTELANEKIQTLEIPYKFTFLSSKNILLPLIHTNAHLFTQILENLKQYEPYAYPFLQKVSKREVPHYYDTIKNPMDLTTMSKKTYTIKEFKSDLDLIWNNCFYFNGESAISEYAQKMKERADFLFAFYFRDYLNMDN